MHDEPRHAMTMDENGPYRPYQPYQPYRYSHSGSVAEAFTQPPRDDAPLSSSFAPSLARALPAISAFLLILASWLPWVTLHIGYGDTVFDSQVSGVEGLLLLVGQSRRSRFAALILLLVWVAIMLFGLFFSLTLQRRRRITRVHIGIYGIWILLATAISLLAFYGAVKAFGFMPCDAGCTGMHRGIEWGVWLTLAVLALGWFALVLLIRQRARLAYLPPVAGERYTALHLVGAAVVTLGVALWLFGLYTVPWATSGCSGLHLSLNHFVRGACSGVDGYDVLSTGLNSNDLQVWPFLVLSSLIGLFVVVTVWLPRLMRPTWAWALVWSLLVTVIAVIGYAGIQMTIAHPPRFSTDDVAPWVASYGVAICVVGLALGWVGGALLAREEISRARQFRQSWPRHVQRA